MLQLDLTWSNYAFFFILWAINCRQSFLSYDIVLGVCDFLHLNGYITEQIWVSFDLSNLWSKRFSVAISSTVTVPAFCYVELHEKEVFFGLKWGFYDLTVGWLLSVFNLSVDFELTLMDSKKISFFIVYLDLLSLGPSSLLILLTFRSTFQFSIITEGLPCGIGDKSYLNDFSVFTRDSFSKRR